MATFIRGLKLVGQEKDSRYNISTYLKINERNEASNFRAEIEKKCKCFDYFGAFNNSEELIKKDYATVNDVYKNTEIVTRIVTLGFVSQDTTMFPEKKVMIQFMNEYFYDKLKRNEKLIIQLNNRVMRMQIEKESADVNRFLDDNTEYEQLKRK